MTAFEIVIGGRFNAVHALRFADGTTEPAHGHDWDVRVRLGADTLDDAACVLDFHAAEAALAGVLSPWHHGDLNALAPFAGNGGLVRNPSAEHVALSIAEGLAPRIASIREAARVLAVEVTEAPGCVAIYRPG